MSIHFDAVTESNASGNDAGTEPFNVTVGDHENRILLAAGFLDATVESVSSATYNGVSLTQLVNTQAGPANLYVGYLIAPDIGTHALNFAFGPSDPAVFRCGAISFYGVDQISTIGGYNHTSRENNNTSPISTTVTVQGATGLVVDFLVADRVTVGITPDGSQTSKMNNTGLWNGGSGHVAGISYKAHAGSDVTMSWVVDTGDGNSDQVLFAVELLPKLVASIGGAQII